MVDIPLTVFGSLQLQVFQGINCISALTDDTIAIADHRLCAVALGHAFKGKAHFHIDSSGKLDILEDLDGVIIVCGTDGVIQSLILATVYLGHKDVVPSICQGGNGGSINGISRELRDQFCRIHTAIFGVEHLLTGTGQLIICVAYGGMCAVFVQIFVDKNGSHFIGLGQRLILGQRNILECIVVHCHRILCSIGKCQLHAPLKIAEGVMADLGGGAAGMTFAQVDGGTGHIPAIKSIACDGHRLGGIRPDEILLVIGDLALRCNKIAVGDR